MTVKDVYAFLDEIAPFSAQEKWDNSGLLVGDGNAEVTGILVTLDIDSEAIAVARANGCNLIVAHHPVIFSPLHSLLPQNPAFQLAANGIAAICTHTPLDIAAGGINDLLVGCLGREVPLEEPVLPLDEVGCGRIVTLREARSASEIAGIAKKMLGCEVVRYFDCGTPVKTLGICSGSGASMLEEIAGRCDALLTGDVKHDRWYAAREYGVSLLDCGHYHTEVVMVQSLSERLAKRFPGLAVMAWEGGDPVRYV